NYCRGDIAGPLVDDYNLDGWTSLPSTFPSSLRLHGLVEGFARPQSAPLARPVTQRDQWHARRFARPEFLGHARRPRGKALEARTSGSENDGLYLSPLYVSLTVAAGARLVANRQP